MPRLLQKILGDPNERALKPLRELGEIAFVAESRNDHGKRAGAFRHGKDIAFPGAVVGERM